MVGSKTMGELASSIPCEFCDQSVDVIEYDAHLASCRYAQHTMDIPITFMVGANEGVSDTDSDVDSTELEFMYRYITANNQISGGTNLRSFLEDHFSSGSQSQPNRNLLMLRVPQNQHGQGSMRLTSYEYLSTLSDVEVGVSDINAVSKYVDYENVEDDTCAICQQAFKDIWDENISIRQLRCDHVYCDECISTWLKTHKNCPVCKHVFE